MQLPRAIGQGDEVEIVLGEGVRPLRAVVRPAVLDPRRADLDRWVDAFGLEQLDVAVVAADDALSEQDVTVFSLEQLLLAFEQFAALVLGRVDHAEQELLAVCHLTLVLGLHAGEVDLQHRRTEHAQRHVDQLHLSGRVDLNHLLEDAEGLIHVLRAVDSHLVVQSFWPLLNAFGLLQNSVDLAFTAVELGDLIQASADLVAVQTARHRQRVVVALRDDAVVVAEDEAIKGQVVSENTVRLPVDLCEFGADFGRSYDFCLAPSDLDAYLLRFEAWVADVFRRAEFLEGVVSVPVRLIVQRNELGPVDLLKWQRPGFLYLRLGAWLWGRFAYC